MFHNDSSRPTILVADDEPQQLKIISYALKQSFNVVTAANMEQAITVASTTTLDVALCDYRMPGPDGIRTLAVLREKQPECIRFLVTAHGDMDILKEAINTGAVYRFISKPVQLNALVTDITRAIEYTAARRQLEKAERLALAGTLASMAVHDMRNALQGIALIPALLAEVHGPEIETVRTLAASSCATMNECIKEILSAARGGPPTYELVDLSFTKLITEVISQYRSIYSTHTFHLEINTEDDPLQVKMASSPIRRVISNLLLNAIQASEGEKTVHIKVSLESDRITYRIEDNGPGVPIENRESIFAGMFTTKGSNGTGLGLKQCRQIMRAHGGDLILSSESTRGASFVGFFPRT